MSRSTITHVALDDWIAHETIPFSSDSTEAFNAAVDEVIAAHGHSVELLGFGEALHGSEELLFLRNQLFQRLVKTHGYIAIAVESSFTRGRAVNEYVAGRGAASYEEVQETGFSHGFGRSAANRELVEWMRAYNAEPSHKVKLQFFGFDSPTEMTFADSPRHSLEFALAYLASIDRASADEHRGRIDQLLANDAEWENPAAGLDPAKSVGETPAAAALRVETEELISELSVRRPELVAKSDPDRYREAVHYATVARQLLNYHAGLARTSSKRLVELLGIRDAIMADNLAYIVSRERGRVSTSSAPAALTSSVQGGRVLAFAHNSHLKCGRAEWQWGPQFLAWWPAGAHLKEMLGPRYAVIGTAIGISDANGIGQPESGALEACLTAAPGPARFIPTHKGNGLPAAEIAALPTRSGSTKNPTYFPLTQQSFTDFDWLAVVDQL